MKLYNFLLILATGLVLSTSMMAAAGQDDNFTAERDREVANSKERMRIAEDRLNCLQGAKDKEALKSCHEAANKKLDVLEAKIKSQLPDKKDNSDAKDTPHAKDKHK